VADIVPLVEENRILVSRGLQILDESRRPGIVALKKVSSITEKVTSMDLGFRLGPRLNASGRLDTAQASLDLLISEDPEQAQELAELLDEQNQERQKLESHIHAEAQSAMEEQLRSSDAAGLVVAASDWHPGVIGIVASRLVKKYWRPVFVVAIGPDGIGKGSGRSVTGISLVEAINSCRDLLINGGGHEMAAGITLQEKNYEEFRERFADAVSRLALDGQLEPKLFGDAETRLPELTLDFLRSYEQLQPFGSGNPQPLFMALGVEPAGEPRLIKGKHIKFEFYQDGVVRQGIWFNGARENQSLVLPRPPWDVAFFVEKNTFRNVSSVQMLVQSLRSSGPVRRIRPAAADLEMGIAG
jgi:single-stranded-DNA-specific exonuclease